MRLASRIARSACLLAVLVSCATLASADCLSLSGEAPGSTCEASSAIVAWSNGPASPVVESKPSNWYAPDLGDPAFTALKDALDIVQNVLNFFWVDVIATRNN